MANQKEENYLERLTEATITRDNQKVELVFHRAKIKLTDQLEINLLQTISPEFKREFQLTDDQLIIRLHPPEYFHVFEMIHKKSIDSKWRFAYNIIQAVQRHSLNRFMFVVCPENIMFDQGLLPYFLHYGVKESIPPYESDSERVWQEMKATIAACVDEKYDFISYLSHYETIKLSPVTKKIMEAENLEQLLAIVEENLQQNEEYEKTVVHIPKKKWSFSRYSILVLALLLIPSLIYTAFAAFFKIPQTEAYVESNRYFLQDQYSSVIDTLQNYDLEDMPYVVQYQLARSYLTYESLDESQRKNILNTITLQSDQRYFTYWIDVGRGNYEEAVDVARLLESRDLIMYGLLKEREAVKADQSLSGGEREEKVKSINQELEGYQNEIEEEEKEQEAEKTTEDEVEESIPSGSNTNSDGAVDENGASTNDENATESNVQVEESDQASNNSESTTDDTTNNSNN